MAGWQSLAVEYDPLCVGHINGTKGVVHDRGLIRALEAKYKPNKKVVGDPKCSIFVGRLDPGTTEESIQEFFSRYGKIRSVRLVRDIVTGASRRYAFVEFVSRRDAVRAYERAHHKILDGREILVDVEHERTMQGWVPRRLGGGFGGKKESGQLRFGCRDRPWKKPIRLGVAKPRYSSSTPRKRREAEKGGSSKTL